MFFDLGEIKIIVIIDSIAFNKPKNKYECLHENKPAIKTAVSGPKADPIEPNMP